jgi:hypothetical protein
MAYFKAHGTIRNHPPVSTYAEMWFLKLTGRSFRFVPFPGGALGWKRLQGGPPIHHESRRVNPAPVKPMQRNLWGAGACDSPVTRYFASWSESPG